MKKLSLKGLADYMTASPTRQRSILHGYKYPAEDESRAKILYYREARDRIAAYHASQHNPDWLLAQAHSLAIVAGHSAGRRRSRLQHNARGIQQYARHFGGRQFEVLDDFSHDLQFGDVFISVYPDLHVRERGAEKIIKLEFSAIEPSAEMIQILCQCMLEAASGARMPVRPSDVLLLDVPRGASHRGARIRARMTRDIQATCQNISSIWDAI